MQSCAICSKSGNRVWRRVKLRGKYNPTVKRTQKPNLQWVRLDSGDRKKVCVKCMKTLTKT